MIPPFVHRTIVSPSQVPEHSSRGRYKRADEVAKAGPNGTISSIESAGCGATEHARNGRVRKPWGSDVDESMGKQTTDLAGFLWQVGQRRRTISMPPHRLDAVPCPFYFACAHSAKPHGPSYVRSAGRFQQASMIRACRHRSAPGPWSAVTAKSVLFS